MRVVAVIVTFNRLNFLKTCVESVQSQSRLPDEIIVVDNASDDGTAEWLDLETATARTAFTVIRSATNTGGAGGFNIGMRAALDAAADWVWSMDDDVLAHQTCLEILLEHTAISECIHPNRYNSRGEEFAWESSIDASTLIATELGNISFQNGLTLTFQNTACFEGVLISRRLLSAVGLPNPEFFIYGDDTAWGLVASAFTNIVLVRDAKMTRLIMESPVKPWKTYYLVRNLFLVRRDVVRGLDLRTSGTSNILFWANVICQTYRAARQGPAHVLPALRGLRDGRALSSRKSDFSAGR